MKLLLTLLVAVFLLIVPSAGTKSSKITKTSKTSILPSDSPAPHAKSKKNAQISKKRSSKTAKKTSNKTSSAPSDRQSSAPSNSPSSAPSDSPSSTPSSAPTENPSSAPSDAPSAALSEVPSEAPSELPSVAPPEGPCSAETFSTEDIVVGIECTDDGGTLLLTAGTYSEAELVIGKSIIISCTVADQACILDGLTTHRVVQVAAGSGNAVSLNGLNITKGSGSNSYGAGVWISSGSVTMTDCFISDNDAGPSIGGGVFVSSGSATLVNCVLEGNSAYLGGGMYVGGTATLYGCTFADNTASVEGPDIANYGTVSVYGDELGVTSGCTQGDALGTVGVSGTTYSFSGCTTV